MEHHSTNDNFILAVHGSDNALEILSLAISQAFPGRILSAKTAAEAAGPLGRQAGPPLCVISDDPSLLNRFPCPFLFCGNGALPGAYGVLQTPRFLPDLTRMLGEILADRKDEADYCPIRLSVLLRLGFVNFDLYMRLSDSKFVKVASAESEFAIEDAQKLMKKNVIDLYLRRADAERLLLEFQQNILLLSQDTSSLPAEDLVGISRETFEMTLSLSRSLGWSKEVQTIAQKGTQIAVNAISKSPKLGAFLAKLRAEEGNYLASHSHLITYVSCGTAKLLDWTSEYTFTKLAMAALLHDITLSFTEEGRIRELEAADPQATSAELEFFRRHPANAVALLSELHDLPPDIDK
ncbi:MAG: hypothetical protein ACXVB9_15000, partial [Bdellovibrionota bacterium]